MVEASQAGKKQDGAPSLFFVFLTHINQENDSRLTVEKVRVPTPSSMGLHSTCLPQSNQVERSCGYLRAEKRCGEQGSKSRQQEFLC